MYRSPDLRGGNRLAGGSLRTIAAVFVRIQEERDGRYFVLVCFNIFIPCPFLPGCTGGTGLPAALYSRLRRFWFAYKRNGSVGIWFWCVNNFIPCTFLPGCAGGTGLPVALYSPSRRFWTAYKRNWRVWIWFPRVSTVKLSIYEFPGLRGGNRLPGGSLRTVAAIFVRIQERKGGDLVMTSFCLFLRQTFHLGCARDTRLPTNLYSRLRRF